MKAKTTLYVAIAGMNFLKQNEKRILCDSVSSIEEIDALSADSISGIIGRYLNPQIRAAYCAGESVKAALRVMQAYQIGVLYIDDESYPALLREIFDPPFVLFYRGNPAVLMEPCVSVVGTRQPVANTRRATLVFAKEAAEAGFTVVSGLAYGIDSEAHRGALMAFLSVENCGAPPRRGATCAVLASGVDVITPPGNKALAREILARGGCITSEYLPGQNAAKWRFPERNRVIAGLSLATVVGDAPENSGALITADFAADHGRDVFFLEAGLERLKQNGKQDGRRNAVSYAAQGAPSVSSFADFLEKKDAPPGWVQTRYNTSKS